MQHNSSSSNFGPRGRWSLLHLARLTGTVRTIHMIRSVGIAASIALNRPFLQLLEAGAGQAVRHPRLLASLVDGA